MKITMMGTGYVGLVAGTCFAENGNQVICVDIDANRVRQLKEGHVPFYEPGLEELCKRNIKNGRLNFMTDAAKAVSSSQIIFIAVGTPPKEDGSSNLIYVERAARTIGEYMNEPKIVVIKSTVPVGTSAKVSDLIRKKNKYPFSIVSNPEFLKEGAAITDFLKPERVVIGSEDPQAIEAMKELYAPFVRSGNPIWVMSNTSAELAKYACNAFLAMKISFINEVANLCGKVGGNINDVRSVMMTDSRIGNKFLYPGTGYGGSCFPKDVRALISTAASHGQPLKILSAVEAVNQKQKEILFHKTSAYFKGDLRGKTVAIWGLSFKPNTDDLREAPALTVIQKFLDNGMAIHAYDPVALPNAKTHFEDRVQYFQNSYDCLEGADALLIFTEWNEFRKPDFSAIKKRLKTPVIFDGRNLFSPQETKKHGFIYEGIGL